MCFMVDRKGHVLVGQERTKFRGKHEPVRKFPIVEGLDAEAISGRGGDDRGGSSQIAKANIPLK